jgi:hypothetical protein
LQNCLNKLNVMKEANSYEYLEKRKEIKMYKLFIQLCLIVFLLPVAAPANAGCLDNDLAGLSTFALDWLGDSCSQSDWCGGADINKSTNVDLIDYSMGFGPLAPLILVDNSVCNVSIHNIAIGTPSSVEAYAAEELQAAFQLASNVTPEINPATPAAIEIRLGVSNRFNMNVGNDYEQAYSVRRTFDDHIELVGNCKAAVMWAVDDFCKEVLHVSWPTSTDAIVLVGGQQSTIAVDRLCKIEAPDFPIRGWIIGVNTNYGYHYDNTIGSWMAHNRQNTIHTMTPYLDFADGYNNMLSRGITPDTTMHDFSWLIPTSMYASHPEYFPYIDGARVNGDVYVQRCISNPDVRNIIINEIIAGFNQYPELKVFGVGQNDGGGGWCQCTAATPPYTGNCQGWDGAQAGTGVYSNRLITFINSIADEIAPYYPGKYIGTFAYSETAQPPDIDVSDNVSITLTASGNYMRKLTDPCDTANADIMVRLSAWLNKTENVHFWTYYYTTGMDSCLTPYARSVIEGFSELKALGFKGICGETRPQYWPNQRFFFYAIARAAWDNSLDFDEILDDYSNEAYGPAASDMKSYYLLYETRIYENVPFLSMNGAVEQLFPPSFSPTDMTALEGYLASAETAAVSGSQANIDAVSEVRGMFDKFKLLSIDPCDIPGIGPNLIVNPGAESGQSPWGGDTQSGSFTFSRPYGGAHSGNYSLKIEGSGYGRWVQLNIPVTTGKKYAARFWIRASGGASGIIFVYNIAELGWADSGDEWARVVLPEVTATSSSIQIFMAIFGSGTVYFDDTFLAELPE